MTPKFQVQRVIHYGPLPGGWGCFILGMLSLGAFGVNLWFMQYSKSITCNRTGVNAGTCRIVERTTTSKKSKILYIHEVAEVRFQDTSRRSGGARYGATLFLLRSGEELVALEGPEPRAQPVYREVEHFFSNPTEDMLVAELGPVVNDYLFMIGSAIAALLLLFLFARTISSYRIELQIGGTRMRIRPSYHGLPGRWREWDITDVCNVVVETRMSSRWYSNQQFPSARLLFEKSDNRAIPLPVRFTPANGATAQARMELVDALGLQAPTTPEDEAPDEPAQEEPATSNLAIEYSEEAEDAGFDLPEHQAAAEPAAAAAAPADEPREAAPRGRKVLRLGKRTTIALLVLLIGSPVWIGFIYGLVFAEKDGGVVVDCQQRCRIGERECTAGQHWSSRMKPGEYLLEIYDPNVVGNWEKIPFTVHPGRRLKVTCRSSTRP